jgi:bla regulator protein blaR1
MSSLDFSFLANHLWQSTICVGIAWLLTLTLKKNRAVVRYWIWFAASVKFLVPFAPMVALGRMLSWRAVPAVAQSAPSLPFVANAIAQPFDAPLPQTVVQHAPISIAPILLSVWFCGVLIGVLYWFRCWRQVRAVRRNAIPLAFGLPIPVMLSRSKIEPGVFGISRPVLLLPEGIRERLTAGQLEAVLMHEMCHVRRRDNLTAGIHMLVETIFWFHPLLWWIRPQLIKERERACDEEVLARGSDAEKYAEGILAVCKFCSQTPALCISGVGGGDLKKRLLRIMAEPYASKLSFTRKVILSLIAAGTLAAPAFLGMLNPSSAGAQSQPSASNAASDLSFEVASVKLADPDNSTGPMRVGFGATPGGRFEGKNVTVLQMINVAYGLMGTKQIANAPNWAESKRFDIDAKVDNVSGALPADDWAPPMRTLLKERFALVVHRETRELPVYALELVKPGITGPGLHADSAPCPPAPDAPPTQSAMQRPRGAPCGGIRFAPSVAQASSGTTPWNLAGGRITMQELAATLVGAKVLDRNVVDRTGLSGTFDFSIDIAPPLITPGAMPNFNPGPETTPTETTGLPSIFDELRNRLGLRLEATNAPVEVLVIDHIEEPSPN